MGWANQAGGFVDNQQVSVLVEDVEHCGPLCYQRRKDSCRKLLLLGLALAALRAPADKVDDFVANAMRRHPIPGLALEIIQDGRVVKRAGYGLAEVEWQIPVTPEDGV